MEETEGWKDGREEEEWKLLVSLECGADAPLTVCDFCFQEDRVGL